jgi:hypothetical protein
MEPYEYRIVDLIIADLTDRCGFDAAWGDIDEITKLEIRDTWAEIVQRELSEGEEEEEE